MCQSKRAVSFLDRSLTQSSLRQSIRLIKNLAKHPPLKQEQLYTYIHCTLIAQRQNRRIGDARFGHFRDFHGVVEVVCVIGWIMGVERRYSSRALVIVTM